MTNFHETDIREVTKSPAEMIGDDWALVTSGDEEKWNTMTVSWGGLGVMWGKPVAFVFIRPQRYTYEFIEKNDRLSLSFFGGEYKKELGICGSKSGRDIDKSAETGFTADFSDGTPYIEQAKTVFICKKMAYQDIKPAGFLDADIDDKWYPNKDYHRMYVCEIEKVLQKD